jgi:hypothetical protein
MALPRWIARKFTKSARRASRPRLRPELLQYDHDKDRHLLVCERWAAKKCDDSDGDVYRNLPARGPGRFFCEGWLA